MRRTMYKLSFISLLIIWFYVSLPLWQIQYILDLNVWQVQYILLTNI